MNYLVTNLIATSHSHAQNKKEQAEMFLALHEDIFKSDLKLHGSVIKVYQTIHAGDDHLIPNYNIYVIFKDQEALDYYETVAAGAIGGAGPFLNHEETFSGDQAGWDANYGDEPMFYWGMKTLW